VHEDPVQEGGSSPEKETTLVFALKGKRGTAFFPEEGVLSQRGAVSLAFGRAKNQAGAPDVEKLED